MCSALMQCCIDSTTEEKTMAVDVAQEYVDRDVAGMRRMTMDQWKNYDDHALATTGTRKRSR